MPRIIQLLSHQNELYQNELYALTDTGEVFVRVFNTSDELLWGRVGLPDSCEPSKQTSCQGFATSKSCVPDQSQSIFGGAYKLTDINLSDRTDRPMPSPNTVDAMSSPRRPTTIGPDGNYIPYCKVHNHLYLD